MKTEIFLGFANHTNTGVGGLEIRTEGHKIRKVETKVKLGAGLHPSPPATPRARALKRWVRGSREHDGLRGIPRHGPKSRRHRRKGDPERGGRRVTLPALGTPAGSERPGPPRG